MDIPGNDIAASSPGKYFLRHLQVAGSLISAYDGVEPFHLYLKKYFSSNKKHGSKDRKQIASLCYGYFRLGHGARPQVTQQDKFLLGNFLCNFNPSFLLAEFNTGWNEVISSKLKDKLKIVDDFFDPQNIFPFLQNLSNEIDHNAFAISFLQQPKLFLRMRPGKEATVLNKVRSANVSFQKLNNECLVFSNNEKVAGIISLDNEAVVQDYNSQRVGEFFLEERFTEKADDNEEFSTPVWDCCAGSGGKSILAFDKLGDIKLTATDKRLSILQNLKKRFSAAGITNYEASVLDVNSGNQQKINSNFKIAIADVPCSGSGTWARTPEQLSFFKEKEIEKYASLQKNIIKNVVPHIQEKGLLFYITCSVFKKENEENVDYFLKNFQLNFLHKEYLKGYEMQADTLFIAVFEKN